MRPDIQGSDALQMNLLRDRILANEIRLAEEVVEAMYERDIMLLRNQLKKAAKQTEQTSGNGHLSDAEAYFGLSEEIFKPVNLQVDDQEPEIGNYLQKLHLKNHHLASKEVVHDMFSEADEHVEFDNLVMSAEDEMLFEELKDALIEKDITDLRANIRSIAQSVSIHERTFDEIEDLVCGELDDEHEKLIHEEAMINAALSGEIHLLGEINCAIGESDIMKLRASLKGMMANEYSHSRSVDEIDSYLNDEMDEESRSLFESELLNNSSLAAEVDLHKEVQMAVGEKEVMNLRGGLRNISKDGAGNNTRILGLATPKRKLLFWSAAASVIVLISFSSLMQQKSFSGEELYASYYQPYKSGVSISRSVSTSASVMNEAINQMHKGDYATALNMLKIVSTDEQDGFTASFYSGEAYQAIGDYKNAIKSFAEVVQHGDNLLVEQSAWYIGLCYLKLNEKGKAINQFRSIVAGKGYFSQKSKDLLKQLK